MEKIEINATGEKVGRVASKAASLLMGKDSTDFTRNKVASVEVKITNTSKLEISEGKKDGKIYTHYTGYPGGLREETMGKLIDKKGYGEISIFGTSIRKLVPHMPGIKMLLN